MALTAFLRQDVGKGDAGGIVDDMDVFPADTACVALTGPVAGDAVADAMKAEALDVEMDPGRPALRTHDGSAGVMSFIRDRPARLRTRLTVAGETPVSMAMCLPVSRCRRRPMMRSTKA